MPEYVIGGMPSYMLHQGYTGNISFMPNSKDPAAIVESSRNDAFKKNKTSNIYDGKNDSLEILRAEAPVDDISYKSPKFRIEQDKQN